MPTLGAQTIYSPEEYLFLERKATTKNEYLNGEVFAMPRVNLAHNLITVDIATVLNVQSRRLNCVVFSSCMRVKERQSDSYFYPDVVIACGESQFEDDTFDTLLNPVVIIEVLSPSTEIYDRTEKFEYYKQIPTLQEYMLVSQDKVKVEHHSIRGTQWRLREYQELQDTIILSSIECKLSLNDVYRRVNLDQ